MSDQPPPLPVPALAYATPPGYQPPPVLQAGVWRDGPILVCTKSIILPPHCCVLCDQPADGRPLTRKFSWHEPWLYLTILMGVIIYAIIAISVSQKATVVVPLCRRHRGRRTKMIAGALLLMFAGFAGLIAAAVINEAWPAIAGGLALLMAAIVGIVGTQTISPRRMDPNFAWFKGASETYLSQLPPIHPQG